jgi:hypothetical protein
MLRKHWKITSFVWVLIFIFQVLSYDLILAVQDTDPPGSTPYPLFPPTVDVRPLEAYPSPESYPLDSPVAPDRPTNTPSPTFDLERSSEDGMTPTLIPIPALPLNFPVFSPTPSPTITEAVIGILNSENNSILQVDERIDREIESIGLVIVVIWLLLGAFLILYLKRIGY